MRYLEDHLYLLLVSCFPAYLFWKWLYKKLIINDRKRSIATWFSTVVVTPALLWGCAMLLLMWLFYYPETSFDKAKWHADKEARYQMSHRMIKSKMLIGKSRNEIKALLGSDYYSYNNGVDWHYYLGFVPSVSNIDADILDITFKNERVVMVGQHNG